MSFQIANVKVGESFSFDGKIYTVEQHHCGYYGDLSWVKSERGYSQRMYSSLRVEPVKQFNIEEFVFFTNVGNLRIEGLKPDQFRVYNVHSGKHIGFINASLIGCFSESDFEGFWTEEIEKLDVEVYGMKEVNQENLEKIRQIIVQIDNLYYERIKLVERGHYTWKELAKVDRISAIKKLRQVSNLNLESAKIAVDEFLGCGYNDSNAVS